MASSGSTETQVWKTLSQNPNLTAPQLAPLCKSITTKQLVEALNSLLAKDLVKVAKTNDGKLTWKAVDVSDAKTKNAMAGDERMVYSAIEALGNQGIWSRTITNQTNLPNAVVTKILNKLMSSKQIKQVKAVNHPTRKMYMVSHIEPSVDLTGGPWYTDFELDPAFIGFVRSACLNFVRKNSFPDPEDESSTAPLYPTTWIDKYPNLHDILRFVKSSKITDVNLLPEHIEEIMNILIYEGLVEKLPAVGGGVASKKGGDSGGEDSDDGMSTGSRKRKHKSSKKRRGSDDDSGSASDEDEGKRKKRRKKGRRNPSDEEDSMESDEGQGRSKKRKGGRKRNASDSESESDEGGSSKHRGRDKKRKRDRSRTLSSDEDSESDADDRRSKSRKKSRRGSDSEDSDDDRRRSSSKKSKGKKGNDGEDDEKIDLDSAFGHLFNNNSVYRAIRPEHIGLGWSQAPCARCPQLEFCEDGGPVNPKGCKYYGDWLAQALGD